MVASCNGAFKITEQGHRNHQRAKLNVYCGFPPPQLSRTKIIVLHGSNLGPVVGGKPREKTERCCASTFLRIVGSTAAPPRFRVLVVKGKGFMVQTHHAH